MDRSLQLNACRTPVSEAQLEARSSELGASGEASERQ